MEKIEDIIKKANFKEEERIEAFDKILESYLGKTINQIELNSFQNLLDQFLRNGSFINSEKNILKYKKYNELYGNLFVLKYFPSN